MLNVTPEDVSELVSFKRRDMEWRYSPPHKSGTRSKDMASLQAEGVSGLIKRLIQHNVALLADEVGTGKTLQALSVAAIKLMQDPDSRVLVLTPRQAVADQWPLEFSTLVNNHFKGELKSILEDLQVPVLARLHSNSPMAKPDEEWVKDNSSGNEVSLKDARLIVGKFSSFSYLRQFQENEHRSVEDLYHSRLEQIEKALGHFNLIIIDEAHYFRNAGSNRYNVAKTLFCQKDNKITIAAKQCHFLLLSATPIHSSTCDINQIMEVVGKGGLISSREQDTPEKIASQVLDRIAIRRFRRLTDSGHTKHRYRQGVSLPSSFRADPDSELFYAMYQRMLVQLENSGVGKQKSQLKHYLEGVEFDPERFSSRRKLNKKVNEDKKRMRSSEHSAEPKEQSIDYSEGRDTEMLRGLLKAYQVSMGKLPSNPKYTSTVDAIWSRIWPQSKQDYGRAEKVLVFTRRIASTTELTSQLIRKFDEELWSMIRNAAKGTIALRRSVPASREEFEKLTRPLRRKDEVSQVSAYEDSDEVSAELTQQSIILSMFRTQKEGVRSTIASNFRRLFDKRKDQDTPYPHFFEVNYEASIFTLLGNINNSKENEEIAKLLKKAVLHSSIGLVELFCCYIESNRRYGDFFGRVKQKWERNEFRFKHEVQAMVSQYEIYKEKFLSIKDKKALNSENAWNMFNQNAPAYAYSGLTKNESILKCFNSSFFPKVLVATSVLQEGVNLQLNCKTVLHYGHAWTPGDDEQRIGRVDRIYGQIARELEEDETAKLPIIYPYLEKTHDESALKFFLKRKNEIADALDQLKVSTDSSPGDIEEDAVVHLTVDDLLPMPAVDESVKDPYSA